MGRPFSSSAPVSGDARPAMRLTSVVLPDPENPTIATNSPSAIERLMSRNTELRAAPAPKPLLTPLSSRKGMR
jgi:hypothetical protein